MGFVFQWSEKTSHLNMSSLYHAVFSLPHLPGPQTRRLASKVVQQARREVIIQYLKCDWGRPSSCGRLNAPFLLSDDWDLLDFNNLGMCLLCSLILRKYELQQTVWPSETDAAAKSCMRRALCVLIRVYGWPKGHGNLSIRPLITMCGCWIEKAFISSCRTRIIHLSHTSPIPIFVF